MSEPDEPIRLLVVDDDGLFREGIAMILESDPGLRVVAKVADGRAALEHLEQHPGEVDLVLMDVDMPGMDGVETTRRIVAADGPRVLILTTFALDEYAYGAISAGASGFLLKDTSPDALIAAVVSAHNGTAVVSPEMTRQLVSSMVPPGHGPDPQLQEPLAALTERELEVLRLIGLGRNNAEISAELFIAEVTVKTHVGRVLRKLGARDRIQAVVFAHRAGLLPPQG
ncbi:response regulator [Desertihabitans aurantiacus]|uniref:response regulator n=1 Tax=Desertihabitans aurantiacus TaxID=2282477 RepID=UPI000DF79FA8|nr:response regulator transcription factor [Desertihabitans aurantiacus]